MFFPPVIRLMGLQATPNDPAAVAARDAAGRFYVEMEKLMDDGREWLAAEYSYADIAFFMAQIFADRMGAPVPEQAVRLQAW